MQDHDDEPTQRELHRSKQAKKKRFLAWCKENGRDPEDDGAWDDFDEVDSSWDRMDADDLAGHIDDMNKEPK